MKEQIKEITKVTTTVNGHSSVAYQVGPKTFDDKVLVLREIFRDQGELYEKIFGVSREDARLAGWHPDDGDFYTSCNGWVEFLKAKGKIDKQVQVETISIEDFVHSILNF